MDKKLIKQRKANQEGQFDQASFVYQDNFNKLVNKDYTKGLKPLAALFTEFDFAWGHGVSTDSPLKVAINLAVNELFSDQKGLEYTDTDSAYKQGLEDYKKSPLAWQALALAQYQVTQDYLNQHLPSTQESVVCFRLAEDHPSLNPLASFTLTNQGLTDYVEHCCAEKQTSNRYWHVAVPKQRIYSFENVGPGENWQQEILVIGSNQEDKNCYSDDHSLAC